MSQVGCGAIHYACRCSNVEVLRLLLARGANKTLADKNGNGPEVYANTSTTKKEELLALLSA